jgi:lantibiotic biosynthesis protein
MLSKSGERKRLFGHAPVTVSQNLISYEPLDAVLVRVPLLPVEAYPTDAPVTTRHRWIDAAIEVASQALAQARSEPRSAAPLRRYQIRMATRPTPYGLFSGVGLARWGDTTTLGLADEPPRTRTRPDMAWLLRLVMRLEIKEEIRCALTVRANTALLIRGGRIILAERMSHAGEGAEPARVSVRSTSAVRLVLELAREPVTYSGLFETVAAAATNVPPDRIESLLLELLNQSLLVTSLRPPLTCESPADWVLKRLAEIPAAQDVREQLEDFLCKASAWDSCPVEERAVAYRRLAAAAIELGAKSNEAPLQVDTTFALSGDCIRREIGIEVARAAEVMLRLSPMPLGFPYLRSYRQAFVTRYGQHREVPLLELLDPYWGLGPPDPNAQSDWVEFQERDQALLELACGAMRGRRISVDLDETMLGRLETHQSEPGNLPPSLDVCAFVSAGSGGVEHGDFKVVIGRNVGSIGAGRNLGRFAHILGEPGRAAALIAAGVEADTSGALIAEIVYLPRTFRLANVAVRPMTRDYEIALGVSPGVSPEHDIPLDELVVGVEDDRFYLRWPGRAERVIVSSSHMLNFREAAPLCRFLAHMHADAMVQLHIFDWGPASRFPFLPRVQVGKAVLKPAEWRIFATVGVPAAKTTEEFRTFLTKQRAEWQLPRHVYLSSGDVRLLLDLDVVEHIEELRREARHLKPGMHLLLQEALPGLEDAWVTGPGGHYVLELVVSLARKNASQKKPQRSFAATRSDTDVARWIPPSSDWLYLKLYGSPETEDDLLTGPLAQFLSEASVAGLPQRCFFLRYSDPDPHLRLRFRTPTPADAEGMMLEICALGRSLMEHELCTRFALDSYERETERYGGPEAICLMEDLFVADSALVFELLNWLKSSALTRETLAAITTCDLVDGLCLDDAANTELEFQLRSSRDEAGAAYRDLKSILYPLVCEPDSFAREVDSREILLLFEQRRAVAGQAGRQLKRLDGEGQLCGPLVDIYQSVLHVHCNRLVGRDRAEERRVLGLMVRSRQARRARSAGDAKKIGFDSHFGIGDKT